jgi:hypothetical protein
VAVPSAIAPENVVLNPSHDHAKDITIVKVGEHRSILEYS